MVSAKSPSRAAWVPVPLLALSMMLACAANPSPPAKSSGPAPSAVKAVLSPITPPELITRIQRSTAKATVLNVWATWCAPCTEELPDFLKFRAAHADRGVDVVFLSGDFKSQRDAAANFLGGLGVNFETFVHEGTDAELINGLNPAWSGALPVTIVYGPGGVRSRFIEGRVTYEALEREVLDVLGRQP